MATENPNLQKTLTPTLLWGLGVGYVISGMYFGWNLGLQQGGTLGMALATALAILMYVGFTLSYAELACAIPKAGGAFDYASRAMGSTGGFLAGMAQNIEFLFAPPAIAAGIGAYLSLFFPNIPPAVFAFSVYILFTLLNILGTHLAARFELFVTVVAVLGLILFAGITLPDFSAESFTANALPNGWGGVFAAIPFAIWFFLGIEGLANVAEESLNPQRDLTRGFLFAMTTLVLLCGLTFVSAVGVSGWEGVVFDQNGAASDSPLPLALQRIGTAKHPLYTLLIIFGLFGLVASFHGLLLAAGRATYEFCRMGNGPAFLGKVHDKFRTPSNALLINMLIGLAALMTQSTAEIIILSAFGALTMYSYSLVSFIILRKKEPNLPRPFRTPAYPLVPWLTLTIALISLVALTVYNPMSALWFAGILGGSFGLKKIVG
ncbi:ethanolamine permease [Arundinibacter roseus]|uniref:Ethanolamine permease n=1 Tax=Arundinibacter roseus TaxID=2070510 RepID=A0A4V2XAL3_9BACT|nr:ethanolamine permease [Arundinibacter roseus]TDB68025.1 ethanolamine permease [Arundinibacter roseus]